MPKLFWIPMVWAACVAAQTVEGTVVNSITGGGIASVKVEVVQSDKALYSATTNAEGHFRIEGVKDGHYTARYSSPMGFYELGTSGLDERTVPRPFQVTAGGNVVRLQARMVPLNRITGRVVDGRGDALPNAQLLLTTPTSAQHISTDTNGKFDVHELLFPGGAYLLVVVPPPGLKPPDPEPDSDRVLAWARTYYPGVALPNAASKVVLRPGDELLDIEMKLLAVPSYAVQGVLLNPDGTPAPKVAITLEQSGLTPPAFRVESKTDGTFEFRAVVDGEWRLSAEVERGGVKLRAAQWMTMAGREVEGVKLRLDAPFSVRGKVVIQTPKGWVAPKPPTVFVVPDSRGRGPFLDHPLLVRADADGDFSLDPVYPGTYRINAFERPPGYYLDAVRLGEAEIQLPEVELFYGGLPITLVYKANGGTVRGAVEKCASGGVVLIPQDPAMRWLAYIYSATCDLNDRYEITAVRPGEYYALATSVEGSLPFWMLGWFTDGFINQASRVTVRAGEASSANLRAMTQRTF